MSVEDRPGATDEVTTTAGRGRPMSIRMEWDVPFAGESAPFGDLASFVERALAAQAPSYRTPEVTSGLGR
jgi:hypothetical protein